MAVESGNGLSGMTVLQEESQGRATSIFRERTRSTKGGCARGAGGRHANMVTWGRQMPAFDAPMIKSETCECPSLTRNAGRLDRRTAADPRFREAATMLFAAWPRPSRRRSSDNHAGGGDLGRGAARAR